jgi:hypothetical protein
VITIKGFFEDYKIRTSKEQNTQLWLKIEDIKNNVSIQGFPVKFEYFIGETGKYEFMAVFSSYTVNTGERINKGGV